MSRFIWFIFSCFQHTNTTRTTARRRSIFACRCRRVQTPNLCGLPIARNTGWAVPGGNPDRRLGGSRAAWSVAPTRKATWVYTVDTLWSRVDYIAAWAYLIFIGALKFPKRWKGRATSGFLDYLLILCKLIMMRVNDFFVTVRFNVIQHIYGLYRFWAYSIYNVVFFSVCHQHIF